MTVTIDKRTEFEKQLGEFIQRLEYFMDSPRTFANHYQDVRGRLRDLKVNLVNKSFGCASGRHARGCDC